MREPFITKFNVSLFKSEAKGKQQHQDLGRAHRMIYPKFDFGVTLSHVTTITTVKNVSSETVNCTQTKVIHIYISSTANRRGKRLEKFPMGRGNHDECFSESFHMFSVELWTNSGSRGLLLNPKEVDKKIKSSADIHGFLYGDD